MRTEIALPTDVLAPLVRREPFLWLNPNWRPAREAEGQLPLTRDAIDDAQARWLRFAPVLELLFPELAESRGIIESPLRRVDRLRAACMGNDPRAGEWLMKCDHALPVAGSIKARGGIYEVLLHAERLALQAGLLQTGDDPKQLTSDSTKQFFARHEVTVGSTGNLGLSIGIAAAALGFRATVHMSADAKAWKKDRLRARGVKVVEHEGDFGAAVAAGRAQASADPAVYFVDDEQSKHLFLGYSVAALRLQQQLRDIGVQPGAAHPLIVYIPCGVGGAPGGITFGLRLLFDDHVHCFFAEPVASPCMLVRLAALEDKPISVRDIGLDNCTEADGLAVGRASELAAATMRPLVSGIFTGRDEDFFADLYRLRESEGIEIEPSAAAGFRGPQWLLSSSAGRAYLGAHALEKHMSHATHILWTTGGSFVPAHEYRSFYERGRAVQ